MLSEGMQNSAVESLTSGLTCCEGAGGLETRVQTPADRRPTESDRRLPRPSSATFRSRNWPPSKRANLKRFIQHAAK